MSNNSPNKNGIFMHKPDEAQEAHVQLTPDGESTEIGSRIREIRKQRGLTIRALAEICEISPNTLSLIENDRTSPNIRTLGQLATGLDVTISSFLEPEDPGQNVVYQRHGQRSVTRFANGMIENLGDGLPHLGAEPILVTLENHPAEIEDVSHAGREFVYCIAGNVACSIGGIQYILSVGDSLLFDANLPHHWENTRAHPSRLLVLFCPTDAHDRPVEQHLDH